MIELEEEQVVEHMNRAPWQSNERIKQQIPAADWPQIRNRLIAKIKATPSFVVTQRLAEIYEREGLWDEIQTYPRRHAMIEELDRL